MSDNSLILQHLTKYELFYWNNTKSYLLVSDLISANLTGGDYDEIIAADRYGRFPFILLARGLGPFDSLSLYLFKDYNKLLWAYGVIGFAGGLGGGRLRGGGYMGGPAWQALVADIVPSKDRAKVMGLMGTILKYNPTN